MSSKESGGSDQQTTTPSLFATAANTFTRFGSNRNLSPPSSKYRVSSLLSATGVGVATTTPAPSISSSPSTRKLHDLVRQVSAKESRNSFKLSDAIVGGSNITPSQDVSPPRGKLPQKMRASVTRMRSQAVLMNNNSSSESPTKLHQRHSSVFGRGLPLFPGTASSPVATVASAASTLRRRPSKQRRALSASQHGLGQEYEPSTSTPPSPIQQVNAVSLPTNNSDPAFVLRFMELLRPLQTSMRSLQDAGGISDDDDEDEHKADALFRQHERESSRILRICCSLDNLLVAITDQVQENKQDLLAIVRGPAQELVQLILNGIRQIVAAMATPEQNGHEPYADGMPSLTAKEERCLRDFLIEIADRWSKLDQLLRAVYTASLQIVQGELAELQALHAELQDEKKVLELELLNFREFNSSQSAATMAVTSNFMRLANEEANHKHPETENDTRNEDESLAGYDLKENDDRKGEHRTAAEEVEILKKQCEEYGRLLEMAKQEIRLSHQERQSQNARIIEMSQSLLKDQEVAQLRIELQSEKKRVKLLEMESLSLRETQLDLNLKLQSLMLNQSGNIVTTPTPTKPNVNLRGVATASATPPLTRQRSGSAIVRREEIASAMAGAPIQLTLDEAVSGTTAKAPILAENGESAQNGPQIFSSGSGAMKLETAKSWMHRVIEVNIGEKEDDGLVRQFLANLLMSEKELEAAAAQAKLRKRANIPTTGSPPLRSGSGQAFSPAKKKKSKPPSAAQDPNTIVIPVDEWIGDTIVVASVRQLIWVFYELYLMAEEARRIDPDLCGRAKWHKETTAPLASFVLHYFLIRYASESDAISNLRRFVLVLSKLRTEYGDVQLFCEFLEGERSREELDFLLWVVQAIDVIDLGVNYDDESSVATTTTRLGRNICTLKALYVTRMVYQLLHLKALKKPVPVTSKRSAKGKVSNPPAAALAQPTSPSKKRRKSRPPSASSTATVPTVNTMSGDLPVGIDRQDDARVSLFAQAREQFTQAVATNSGCPLTLESFNNIVLLFAEAPTVEELRDRLGPFYQPTGDERRVPLDVFLVLLVELFSTQLHWRKMQLRALFVRLAKEEETAMLLAAKLRLEEEEAAAAQGKKERGRGIEKKEKKKIKLSPSKKRQRRLGVDASNERYLTGLNLERLRNFLVQGGLVKDLVDLDLDMVYIALLDRSNRTPREIHFEDVYSALMDFEILGNDNYAVDFSTWEAKVATGTRDNMSELQSVVMDKWQQLSSRVIVLTENDPNVVIRRTARELLRRTSNTNILIRRNCCDTEMELINAIRKFLGFAWRVACRRVNASEDRRAQLHCCLTEIFYLNQAIVALSHSDAHYTSAVDHGTLVSSAGHEQDQLAVFYDTKHLSRLLNELFNSKISKESLNDEHLVDVQRVLHRYAVYLAHLYDRYSSARYIDNGIGLTKDQWIAMALSTGLVQEPGLSVATLELLFVAVGSACGPVIPSREDKSQSTDQHVMQGGYEVVVKKSQFTSMLVLVALKRHEIIKKHNKQQHQSMSKSQEGSLKLDRVVERFCREVVVPHAFGHDERSLEDNFHRKLANVHVAKVLLEHRAFLRRLFFHYVLHHLNDDGCDATTEQAIEFDPQDERRLKSTHNSMTVEQFTTFLQEFGLLEKCVAVDKRRGSSVLQLDKDGVKYLFRVVMTIESDNDTLMEFDEFAAAVAAIAALRNPNPFLVWYVKIDEFVEELRYRAPRAMGHEHGSTAR